MKRETKRGRIFAKAFSDILVIRLFDHLFWEIGEPAYGEFERDVPEGLYIIRCEFGSPPLEKRVRVEAGKTAEVRFDESDVLGLSAKTSAPIWGHPNVHEFYSRHAQEVIAADKADKKMRKSGARIMLMNWRREENMEGAVNLRGFNLLNAKGQKVCDFVRKSAQTDAEKYRRDEDNRRARYACSVDLPPGGYLLAWPRTYGPKGHLTCLPIWVPNADIDGPWVCSIFVSLQKDDKFPAFEDTSVHITRKNDFEPGGISQGNAGILVTATELALASLRSGRSQLSAAMRNHLLYDKYRNPMSGLLGAYMLLQEGRFETGFFDEVFGNLERVLPGHPDLAGLAALAMRKGHNVNFIPTPISFPPMIQEGARALREMEWENDQWTVTEGSLAALACQDRSGGGPWTLCPFPKPDRLKKDHGKGAKAPKTVTMTYMKNIDSDLSRAIGLSSHPIERTKKFSLAEEVASSPARSRRHTPSKRVPAAKKPWRPISPAKLLHGHFAKTEAQAVKAIIKNSKTLIREVHSESLSRDWKPSETFIEGITASGKLQLRHAGFSPGEATKIMNEAMEKQGISSTEG